MCLAIHELMQQKHILVHCLIKQCIWKRFGIFVCVSYIYCIWHPQPPYTPSPKRNNEATAHGLNVFTAFKWMEMTASILCGKVAACQDLERLLYCHDKEKKKKNIKRQLFLLRRQRKEIQYVCVCMCVRQCDSGVVGYPCGFNYCSIVAGLS